jgi:transposase
MNAHQTIQGVTEAVQLAAEPRRGRPTKFTPERMRQITNLVERGKSREEIAEIIGVTTGTLQVTCSKLGISLRQPRFNTGTGLLRRRRPGRENIASSASQSILITQCVTSAQDQPMADSAPMKEAELSNAGQECGTEDSASVNLSIRMQYKGKERTTELPLTQDMVGRFALEAEFRGMSTGDLIGRLIAAAIENDMVQVVLDQSRGNRTPQWLNRKK